MELEGSQLVKLYLQAEVLIGNVHFTQGPETRFSDALNGITDAGSIRKGRFLELTDVTIRNTDGSEENLKFAYINKSTVQLAVPLGNPDSSRSIGQNTGFNPYKFVEKAPIPVRIKTHDYIINGQIYLMSYQKIWQVLDDTPIFLPVTHAKVCTLTNGAREEFPFAAVNKEDILTLQEDNVKQKVEGEPTIA